MSGGKNCYPDSDVLINKYKIAKARDFFSNRLNNQGFCDSMEKVCSILLVLHTGRKNMRKSLSGKEVGMGFSQRKALP